jgi:hypothetical protein
MNVLEFLSQPLQNCKANATGLDPVDEADT